jgi:hypothetical protein
LSMELMRRKEERCLPIFRLDKAIGIAWSLSR